MSIRSTWYSATELLDQAGGSSAVLYGPRQLSNHLTCIMQAIFDIVPAWQGSPSQNIDRIVR